ncbi:hypothetical protein ADL00_23975 [Streptomyces sp. AS58]|nr:hypothetical protein ADL00_23975 [Streptomyces sp. AS58]
MDLGAQSLGDLCLLGVIFGFADVDADRVNISESHVAEPEQDVGTVESTAEEGDCRCISVEFPFHFGKGAKGR